MTYEDGRQSSRVVVDTPTSRREVVRTETTLAPNREGISTGAVAAIVVGAVALVTILFLFLLNNQENAANDNTRVAATQPQQQPIVVQQPPQASQQPIVVQQPGAPAPIVVQQPSGATSSGSNDGNIQANVDKRILDDPNLATLGVITMVSDGKVTLTGTVNSEAMKVSVERAVKEVPGVRAVDNKIVVG